MKKATDIELDEIVKDIVGNEMGVLFLQRGDRTDLFDIMMKGATYEIRMGMFGSNMHITYHLFPLYYTSTDEGLDRSMLPNSRINALSNLFARWNELGYNKRKARDMFNCKAFMAYVDELGFNEADYMLLLVS